MNLKSLINKNPNICGTIITILAVFLVNFFAIPNPNVILLTVMVYVTFIGGFVAGGISCFIIILYSLYFFSLPNELFSYSSVNLKKIIVIIIYIPIMVLIVGTLKYEYNKKTKELEVMNKELQRLSQIDPLTGLFNRRYFQELYQNLYSCSSINKTPLSILMIDIDFFKKYNDCYGHLSGDECLVKVANRISIIQQSSTSIVSRYGGEEFIILLPNTDTLQAKKIATELLQSVESLKIAHIQSCINPNVTVSIGIATETNFDNSDALILIENADQALYKAKESGRNQVSIYE